MEAPVADILTELDRWWPVLGILATFIYGWGIYRLSQSFVTRTEHEALQARLADIEKDANAARQELYILGARLEGLPRAEAIAELRVDVAELRGELEGLKGIMGRVEHTLSLLTEHHMKGE